MKSSGVIFEHAWHDAHEAVVDLSPLTDLRARTTTAHQITHQPKHTAHTSSWGHLLGLGILALALGGLTGPLTPRVRLEAKYAWIQARSFAIVIPDLIGDRFRFSGNTKTDSRLRGNDNTMPVTPAAFNPLQTPDGASIDPVNREFSLVIPKIGVNAAVIPAVNPTKPGEYLEALQKGIAHSSLSYFPNENGTVFLFSHSTNYEWFVGDLNAVFYLLKNLEEKDMVVLFYQGASYTYRITGKQIVNPTAVSYMAPQAGARRLILQTCWPPGSTTERLLIFADLVEESNLEI